MGRTNGKHIFLCTTLLSIVLPTREHIVPLILWKSNSSRFAPQNISHELDHQDLKTILMPLLKDNPPMLLFAEPILNEADLQFFPQLLGLNKVSYFSKVVDPLAQLENITKWHHETLQPGSAQVPVNNNTALFLTMDSSLYSSRNLLFHRHDAAIVDACRLIIKIHGSVLIMLTGFTSYWPLKEMMPTLLRSQATLLYSKTSPILTVRTGTHENTLKLANFTTVQGHRNQFEVKAPNNTLNLASIKFHFIDVHDYYWVLYKIVLTPLKSEVNMTNTVQLRQVEVLEVQDKALQVSAYKDQSYYCGTMTVFTNHKRNVQLEFSSIQVQPFVANSKFSTAKHCLESAVPTSIMLITLTFLYGSLIIGSLWLMCQIQVHTEFEDPTKPHLIIYN